MEPLVFPEMTLCDALDYATLIEEEARERYAELAEQMESHHNFEVARFFRFMLKVESAHEVRILGRRKRTFGDAPTRVNRAMLFDVEAPEYDDVRATMTPREALAVALRAEKKAHAFFEKVLEQVKDPDVRALFTELRDEEIEHAGLVEREMAKLPPDAKFRAEDFEDEPVGH